MNDLARVNFSQMKFARAEELYERSLRIMEREYGDNDAKVIPFVEAVALAYESDSDSRKRKIFAARGWHSRARAGADNIAIVPDLLRLARLNVLRQKRACGRHCVPTRAGHPGENTTAQ